MILSVIMIVVWITALYFSGKIIVDGLQKMAVLLNLQKFIVSFIMMAAVATLPNFFVGITSAFDGIPQLSFGEIAGGNVVDLTIALALAVLFSKNGISVKEKTPRVTAIFAGAAGILPFILTLDGTLTRADGLILIGSFIAYMVWIFSKKERFEKTYKATEDTRKIRKRDVFKELAKIGLAMGLLLIAANGVVQEASAISIALGVVVGAVGILIVGLGNTLPETYMAIASVCRGQEDLVLGDLLGSVITPSLLVLGVVALISPFTIGDPSTFFITRIFLAIAVFLAVFFIWTGKKISKKEAVILFIIYIAFIAAELSKIFFNQ